MHCYTIYVENTGTQFSGSIRIVAALSVALLIAVIGAKWGTHQAPPTIVVRPTEQLSDRSYIPENDGDGDGVPDWLETLQGSSPHDATSKTAASTTQMTLGTSAATTSVSDNTLTQQTLNRMIDGYLALKERGLYTPERAQELGQSITAGIRITTPFTPFILNDLTITTDTSLNATMAHRANIQTVLRPLLTTRNPEIILYGRYLEQRDPADLQEISKRAAQYRSIAQSMVDIPVPADIADTHLATINALTFFASVLDNMVARVEDPFASMALLSVFNRSEQYVETTLTKLADLYRIKLAS